MAYETRLGSLASYEKGGVEVIDDDPKNYAFSNIFEVASLAKPFEQIAVGKNFEYVLEAVRVEGTSGECAETGNINAFGEAQPHQQKLVGHVLARERVVNGKAMAVGLDAHEPRLRPLFRRGRMPVARDIEPAVGARSDAGVFLGAPVDEVMLALSTQARVIGNLVSRQTMRGADLLRHIVERARHRFIRRLELAGRMQAEERRAFFDGELIEREMFGGFRDRAF